MSRSIIVGKYEEMSGFRSFKSSTVLWRGVNASLMSCLVAAVLLSGCDRRKTKPVLEFDRTSIYYKRLPADVRELPQFGACGDVEHRAWREKFPVKYDEVADYSVTQEYCSTLRRSTFFDAVRNHTVRMGCKTYYRLPERLFLKCNGSVKGTAVATYIFDTLVDEARVHVFFTSKQIGFRNSVNLPKKPANDG